MLKRILFTAGMGYLMRRFGIPVAPAVIGLILGPLAEQQMRRALAGRRVGRAAASVLAQQRRRNRHAARGNAAARRGTLHLLIDRGRVRRAGGVPLPR